MASRRTSSPSSPSPRSGRHRAPAHRPAGRRATAPPATAALLTAALLTAAATLAGCAGPDRPGDRPPDETGQFAPDGRTAFVHLFEWTWRDIARECETYLGPRGFAAVQISPPGEHAWIVAGDGAPYPWWMRYQPVSYRLDRSRGGTRAELADMIARCSAAGVAIYADAVINHMTGGAGTTSSAGASPWGHDSYPQVPYSGKDFHAACGISNYRDADNVQRCRLVGLADLDTGASYVRGKIADYLVDLVELGVRGFRIDAAKHISPADLAAIIGEVNARAAARPYWFLEVIGAPGEAVQPPQYFGLSDGQADVTEFRYGRELFAAFAGGGRLAELRTFGEARGMFAGGRAVAFVDNHDKQRGHAGGGDYLTYHRGALYELASAFMLAWPYGYPSIMSSYAFDRATAFDTSHGPPFDPATGATRGPWAAGGAEPACFDRTRGGWVCEHRLRAIGNMVGFRNATLAVPAVTDWWDDGGNRIAFGRGDRGYIVINRDATPLTRRFATGLAAGAYCDVISGDVTPPASAGGAPGCTGTTVTVDADGTAEITAPAVGAAAIHVDARLAP